MSTHTFIFAITATSISTLMFGALPNTSVSYSAVDGAREDSALTADAPAPIASSTPDESPSTPLDTSESTHVDLPPQSPSPEPVEPKKQKTTALHEEQPDTPVPTVPFFSQFSDITSPKWKKIGCGIASLAMLIEYYTPGSLPSVDTLLTEGINADAYINKVGWSYAGLIGVSKKYGLIGTARDLAQSSMDTAFRSLTAALEDGPVMASVHYTFAPTNPIPHLVIVTGIDGDTIHYNDPAENESDGTISLSAFKAAWKKRYIEFHPAS